MIQVALPFLTNVLALFRENKNKISKESGVAADVVEQVARAFEKQLSKDERLIQQAAKEMEKARQHDIQTQIKDIWLVNLLRGLVRPLVTFSVFMWYLYARIQGIPLSAEDYTLIGGILAFWFGIRSFDKKGRI